jgi:hypothetical protein
MLKSQHDHMRRVPSSRSNQLSHFVASVSFILGITVVGLLGTWVARTALTESRGAHLPGRVAGASIVRTCQDIANVPTSCNHTPPSFYLQLGNNPFLLIDHYHP